MKQIPRACPLDNCSLDGMLGVTTQLCYFASQAARDDSVEELMVVAAAVATIAK
jgi:hypothetical protein